MEYVDLVNKIVAAEHSAQEIAREVKEKQDSLDADLKLEVGKLREDYFARATHRIDEVEKTEAAAAEEDMARWDKKRDQALAEVERAYAEHKDQWVELLFSRIVGETERAEV